MHSNPILCFSWFLLFSTWPINTFSLLKNRRADKHHFKTGICTHNIRSTLQLLGESFRRKQHPFEVVNSFLLWLKDGFLIPYQNFCYHKMHTFSEFLNNEKYRIYDPLSKFLTSNEIPMNCIMIPHFLYETYQFNSLPWRQMLNSCSGKLLNQVSGFLQGLSTYPHRKTRQTKKLYQYTSYH